jgi:SAM-dependent methyltransferase
MSDDTGVPPSTASLHGPRWGARAEDWAAAASRLSRRAWEAVADAVDVRPGTRVLDVGCGSGEFLALARSRGAAVSGIDAAEGMIAVARRAVPDGDLRVGPIEALPWDDDAFDVVTGFNAFHFAADLVGALGEARRVARTGGRVAICNWGPRAGNQLPTVMAAVRALQPQREPSRPDPPVGEPGGIERFAREEGLEPLLAGEVDATIEAEDDDTLLRGLTAPGTVVATIAAVGEEAVRRAILDAAAPFRRGDGSYRIENRFRFVVCAA